ncbi:MAG: hypothetical protein AMS27_12380 [Bacteroides sp. SM23_62_1]|nr:MAG: hypothetical protein AMS27_12380 [Bacteroides sp. SM23_62_1]
MTHRQDLDKDLLRFIDGKQMAAAEKAWIEQWISDSRENKEYFEEIKKICGEKKFLKDLEKIDVDKNWTRFQKSVEWSIDKPRVYSIVQKHRLVLSRIAAAILILIVATSVIYFARHVAGNQIIQVSSVDNNTELILSDGSSIILKKGSILNYPEKLSRKKRAISLSGEAFFEVAGMDANPFCVYTGDLTVKVLGTSFNIKEEAEGKITVSVLQGKVLFYRTGDIENALQLGSGQQGIFDSSTGTFEQYSIQSENFLYWKTGKLTYQHESLSVVFGELEDCYNTQFIIGDQEILRNRLTTSFDGQQMEDILNELAILFDLQFTSQGDTIYVRRKHQ